MQRNDNPVLFTAATFYWTEHKLKTRWMEKVAEFDFATHEGLPML